MPKYALEIALRYIRLQFEKGVGRSIPKITTELVTNSDDSYKRMTQPLTSGAFGQIIIIANRRRRKMLVIDQAEGISKDEMQKKLVPYGEESGDRSAGWRTRSLFGKGLRDVLFTQKGGTVKSVKNSQSAVAEFYYGTERKSKQEKPIVDVKDYPPRVDRDLRESWGIRENGTCVEFRLRDDIRFPKREFLRQKLAGFYMLRMINSNPSRKVSLKYIDSNGEEAFDEIKYLFPAGRLIDKRTLEMDFGGKRFGIELEIFQAENDLTQGSAGYEDREGGLLVLDEDDNVLDLTLFRYDNDPSASKLFGKLRINGVGEYIRQKLNSNPPEAIVSEDREGFVRGHGFYKKLAATIEAMLGPIVEEEEKKRRSQTGGFAPETLARYEKAIDALNALYQQLVGKADTGGGFTGKTPKLPDYLEFVRPELTIKQKVLTPVALMINCDKFPQGTQAQVQSDNQNIAAHPERFIIERQSTESPLLVKMLRITGSESGTVGNVVARAMEHPATMRVSVIDKEIFYPQNGMEFNPSNFNLHEESKRSLHLFVDVEKIPIGAVIELKCDSEESMKMNNDIGCIELTVTAHKGIGQKAEIIASSGAYSDKASVQIVKKEEPTPPKGGGRFKPPRFEPIPKLRIQTWLGGDGTILINTLDPLNATYFGSNPIETVEGPKAKLHCQIRLADLVLDECLTQIVTDAYGKGTIERRYPNNPELDIRQYVAEWKFTYGKAIHQHFVTISIVSPSANSNYSKIVEKSNPSKS
jgi:hypothetical protein